MGNVVVLTTVCDRCRYISLRLVSSVWNEVPSLLVETLLFLSEHTATGEFHWRHSAWYDISNLVGQWRFTFDLRFVGHRVSYIWAQIKWAYYASTVDICDLRIGTSAFRMHRIRFGYTRLKPVLRCWMTSAWLLFNQTVDSLARLAILHLAVLNSSRMTNLTSTCWRPLYVVSALLYSTVILQPCIQMILTVSCWAQSGKRVLD